MDASVSTLNTSLDKPPGLPPQNLEAEQSLLGAMMVSPEAIADICENLQEKDFYRQAHRNIFSAIIKLYSNGNPADAITVADQLNKEGKLDDSGGKPYIHTLVASVASPTSATYHAEIIQRNAILRDLIKAANEIANIGFSAPDDLQKAVDEAEELVFSVARHKQVSQFDSMKSLVHQVIEEAKSRANSDRHITGVSTGFKDLDFKLGGLHKSDLIVVAGRPSMGKTSLAINIAQSIGLEGGAVAIFSLEMSRTQLAQRMLCSIAGVDAQKIRTGRLDAGDLERLHEAASVLADVNIFIDDTPSLNTFEIRAKARRLMAKEDVQLIIVDYLQLMHGITGKRTDTREQEVSQISRALKSLARELEVPIIAVSQLSRAIEKRDHKKPMLSDLRESGAIEQDADIVIFIFREEDDDDDDEHKDDSSVVNIDISKHRNGPTGRLQLVFRKRYAEFRDMDHYHND